MTVTLTAELQQCVDSQVATGRFASVDELLSAAVMRLRDDERGADAIVDEADESTAEDGEALDEAEADVAAGRVRDGKDFAAELMTRWRGR